MCTWAVVKPREALGRVTRWWARRVGHEGCGPDLWASEGGALKGWGLERWGLERWGLERWPAGFWVQVFRVQVFKSLRLEGAGFWSSRFRC